MSSRDKPLYISIDSISYKSNRSSLLNSQIDLLNSMKHLHNLKQIKNEKFKLKMRLYALFSSLLADLDRLDPKLPDVEVSSEKKEKLVSQRSVKIDLRKESMESELREIQEKLRRINQH